MLYTPQTQLSDDERLFRQHRILLLLTAFGCSTILVKIADIQILELLFFAYIPFLLIQLAGNRFILAFDAVSKRLVLHYTIFILVAIALGIASLRLKFYPPIEISFLKKPLLLSIARVAEFSIAAIFLIFLYDLFSKSRASLRYCARYYFFAGVASAWFSLISVPILLTTHIPLGVGSDFRARGFYNEGGPYGLYLLTVFFIGLVSKQQRWISPRTWKISLLTLVIVFIASESKAAYIAAFVLFLLATFSASTLRTRVAILSLMCTGLVAAIFVFDLPSKIWLYYQASEQYELLAAKNPEDTNIVVGRVAGLVIVPRMVAAHPWTGIGFGNYGLMRNDPEYRGIAPYVRWFDLPGLGLFGYAAELGLPLLFYFVWMSLIPYYYTRSNSSLALRSLAICPLICMFFGAQLNIYYPWVASSIALGAAYMVKHGVPENGLERVS